jgi:hypothetical protein
VRKLKKAAGRERALRRVVLYGTSLVLWLVLLSPLWIAAFVWWR